MDERRLYKCRECGKTVELETESETVPDCCSRSMDEALPVCLTSDTAEHSRFSENDEPCEDGRSGKI